MAERLVKRRPRGARLEPHPRQGRAARRAGRGSVDRLSDLADVDILFTMVSTAADLEEVLFGKDGVIDGAAGAAPRILVDCSSIGADESAAHPRAASKSRGAAFLASPVSGNGKTVKAGKLSSVVSGPSRRLRSGETVSRDDGRQWRRLRREGDLARICKIAHNVFLGVVIQNLAEITVLAEKAGVPRHAFLQFMNNSVMGSIFTRYKSPALVNLDLDDDVHAGAACARTSTSASTAARELGVADAGDRGDARGTAGAFRRGHSEARDPAAYLRRISPR